MPLEPKLIATQIQPASTDPANILLFLEKLQVASWAEHQRQDR